VIAACHAAPDSEWLAIVDLVAVMLIIGVVLARQAITGGVCSGKLEQGPDLIIGLIALAEDVEQGRDGGWRHCYIFELGPSKRIFRDSNPDLRCATITLNTRGSIANTPLNPIASHANPEY
jgi:hypothetical protein